jgi:integrase
MGVKVLFFRGLWCVRVEYKGKRKSKGYTKEGKANAVAERIRAALDIYGTDAFAILSRQQKALKPKEKPTPLFKAYATRWVEELEMQSLSLSTRTSYRYHAEKHLIPHFGDMLLNEIGYSELKAFVLEQTKKYRKDTVRLDIATMRLIFGEAFREGVVERSPVASLGKFIGGASRRKEKVDPFTLEELHQLEARVAEKHAAYYEFVLMMARTGVRIGEALGLQWKDLDLDKGIALIRRNIPIHRQVQPTKTKSSERSLDLSPELVQALRSLFRRRREEWFAKGETEIPKWVFCGQRGEPFQYSNFRRRCWLRALKDAKVRERTPHDLRHTYASQMLLAGEPLSYVSAQLGHKSPEITLRVYSHWIPGTKRLATHALDCRSAENPQKAPIGVSI